ncbi:CBS domain protein [Alteromonadaceae bacterium 2753L.S.0a.02]|nr:CBS domain protein [Alteromonadaceae bacterium 2753L.S.0a.02]
MGELFVRPVVQELLSHYSLCELMSKDVLTVYEGWSVKQLSEFFVKHGISGAPVIAADGELVGVVSHSDVVRFQSRAPSEVELEKLEQFYCGPYGGGLSQIEIKSLQNRAGETCTVFAIMTPQVISVDITTSVEDACQTIAQNNIHRLFVTKQGKLVGVITAMGILQEVLSA